jgi:hypothetical protein
MGDKVDEIRREHFGVSDDGLRVVEGDVVRATKDELHVKKGERYEVLQVAPDGWLDLLGVPHWYASGIFRVCFDEGGEGDTPTDEAGEMQDAKQDRADSEEQDLERQRMMLVDGFPGEWEWSDSNDRWLQWVHDGRTHVVAYAEETPYGKGYMGCLAVVMGQDNVKLLEASVQGWDFYEVARALKPKAERLVACLEGLGDE